MPLNLEKVDTDTDMGTDMDTVMDTVMVMAMGMGMGMGMVQGMDMDTDMGLVKMGIIQTMKSKKLGFKNYEKKYFQNGGKRNSIGRSNPHKT